MKSNASKGRGTSKGGIVGGREGLMIFLALIGEKCRLSQKTPKILETIKLKMRSVH